MLCFLLLSTTAPHSRGNGAIPLVVQLFCFGIKQFLNPEILRFHMMYDAAVQPPVGVTCTPKISHFFGLCCYTSESSKKQDILKCLSILDLGSK